MSTAKELGERIKRTAAEWRAGTGQQWPMTMKVELHSLIDQLVSLAPAETAAVPVGWKLVPVEATKKMCVAAVKFANGDAVYKNVAAAALEIEEGIYGEAYEAMLAASPQPPAAHKGAMTEEQLAEGFTRTALASLNYGDWFDAGARYAEQFHGIGIPKESEHG